MSKSLLTFQGKITRGRKKGQKMGYPTANIKILEPSNFFPEFGVYAVWVYLKGKRFKGLASIGKAETFNIKEPTIEVHIFDFNKNIYNQKTKVKLVRKLRPMKKFAKVEELVRQIKKDCLAARRILSRKNLELLN